MFRYTSGALALLLVVTTIYYEFKTSGYEVDIKTLEGDISVISMKSSENRNNYTKCKRELKLSNARVDSLEGDVVKVTDELEVWRNKPAVIKYKYRLPEDINMTRGDCNETKRLLDAIRTIDLNTI